MASRRKSRPEPISYEELMNAAGMSGFGALLERPQPSQPALPAPSESNTLCEPRSGDSPTVNEPPPQLDPVMVVQWHTLSDPPSLSVPSSPPTLADANTLTEPNSQSESHRVHQSHSVALQHSVSQPPTLSEQHRAAILRRYHRIYPARTAQDGHSLGEQAVYYALWSAADPETAESRLVSIGYERLAEAARLHWTNVKKNLRNLEAKLAIEAIAPENSGQRIGKTYRVYSYRAILERRRNAALIWYRRTKGVQLLTSEQADAHTLTVSPTLSESITDCLPLRLGEPPTASLSESHRLSLSDSHSPLETIRKQQETPSSELSVQLVEAIREAAGIADDDGIHTLVRLCRQRAADATDSEIAHFVRLKARQALRTGNVANLTGFLHTAVPRCFEGEAFRQFRRGEEQRRELERQQKAVFEAENARFRAEQQGILDDPASTPEQRRLARILLGLDHS